MDEQTRMELGQEAQYVEQENQREQILSELQEGNKNLQSENKRLREAIRNVPTDEYNQAQDDGCDSCGAWDCFLEKLEEWEKEALK